EGGDATGDSFVASWAPAILARETALREDEALLWPAPTYSSKSRMRRRSGKRNIQSAAMPMVPRPPRRTAGTAPMRAAIEPDTNAPSWFEVPVNSECTALTRPSIATGVLIWTSEERITTLTTSAAPRTPSAISDTVKLDETAKTTEATPKTMITRNRVLPMRQRSGRYARNIDVTSAPTAGAERKSPSPPGPVPRISRA